MGGDVDFVWMVMVANGKQGHLAPLSWEVLNIVHGLSGRLIIEVGNCTSRG
jgi:hypothetical protein